MTTENQLFLTPAMLAKRWHMKTNSLATWRWNGAGPAYMKMGKKVLYKIEDIEKFEKEQQLKSTSSSTFYSINTDALGEAIIMQRAKTLALKIKEKAQENSNV